MQLNAKMKSKKFPSKLISITTIAKKGALWSRLKIEMIDFVSCVEYVYVFHFLMPSWLKNCF